MYLSVERWDLALLGAAGVGKTALAIQFTLGRFVTTFDPTLLDGYHRMLAVDDKVCFVQVFDEPGMITGVPTTPIPTRLRESDQ